MGVCSDASQPSDTKSRFHDAIYIPPTRRRRTRRATHRLSSAEPLASALSAATLVFLMDSPNRPACGMALTFFHRNPKMLAQEAGGGKDQGQGIKDKGDGRKEDKGKWLKEPRKKAGRRPRRRVLPFCPTLLPSVIPSPAKDGAQNLRRGLRPIVAVRYHHRPSVETLRFAQSDSLGDRCTQTCPFTRFSAGFRAKRRGDKQGGSDR
jgi:hypothetical protein